MSKTALDPLDRFERLVDKFEKIVDQATKSLNDLLEKQPKLREVEA